MSLQLRSTAAGFKSTDLWQFDEDVPAALQGFDEDEIHDLIENFQQDEIVKEALYKGVDLRHYARQIDKELEEMEGSAVMDCRFYATFLQRCAFLYILVDVREADGVAELYDDISGCEKILEEMKSMLEVSERLEGSVMLHEDVDSRHALAMVPNRGFNVTLGA